MSAATETPWLRLADVLPEPGWPFAGEVRIAVVGQLNTPGQTAATCRVTADLTRAVFELLEALDVAVTWVDVSAEEEPDYTAIRATGGILMLGGGDIEASRYGHTGPVPNEYGVDPRSDERQLRMLHDAIADDSALLAICRSSQLLNVATGGTLIPDLGPATPHRGGPGEPLFLDEEVVLAKDSLVRGLYGDRDRIVVRNGHHQAVGDLGAGLRVAARAHDGVIEATERIENTWIIGVQWHPEEERGSDRRLLFQALADAARHRRARRP